MNKLVLVLLAVAAISTLLVYKHSKSNGSNFLQINESAMRDSFRHFKGKYNKLYGSEEEENKRYNVYKSNVQFIYDHNLKYQKNESSFFLGMNEFTDLTNEEFKKLKIGLAQPRQSENVRFLVSSVPDSVDWRAKNAVTPIKNQGSCGSCWAFSAIGSLEGLNAIKNGNLQAFSEQQLVDCAGGSYGNEGCNGGLMDQAFAYVKDHGITTEDKYPYKGSDNTCQYTDSMKAFTISGFTDVPQNNSAQLKAAIALQPVSIAIEADGLWFQFYLGGVFDHSSCGTNLDHGVLAVGYGTASGKDYYIVKNSWGSTWGEKGFIRIANHNDQGPGICGIQMSASYPNA